MKGTQPPLCKFVYTYHMVWGAQTPSTHTLSFQTTAILCVGLFVCFEHPITGRRANALYLCKDSEDCITKKQEIVHPLVATEINLNLTRSAEETILTELYCVAFRQSISETYMSGSKSCSTSEYVFFTKYHLFTSRL